MKLSFLGDVCLARLINSKFVATNYQIVQPEIIDFLKKSDYVVANLESPITEDDLTDGDHLSFRGTPEMIKQFSFINCFSLSNNHINDCGIEGMYETMEVLDNTNIAHNGLYNEKYQPEIIHKGNNKIALITCTDMMNIPFPDNSPLRTLHIDEPYLNKCIMKYKKDNYFVILFAHVGMLFTRFVNPPIQELLHEKIDFGVDVIITAHSHCLGGMEFYKGKPIFHSLGDFVMDGGSFRRRKAAILNLEIQDGLFKSYELIPTITNKSLETVFAPKRTRLKLLKSWEFVSDKLKINTDDYKSFFKKQYKKEMAQHTLSTLAFLVKSRGVIGTFRILIKRFEEVKRMRKWLSKNRSNDRRDDEAILKDRKRFSQKDLY